MALFRSESPNLGSLTDVQMATGAHVLVSKDITLLPALPLAINPNSQRTYVITAAAATAYTLAAPSLGTASSATPGVPTDGKIIIVSSGTNFAHTITFPTGVLKDGVAAVTVATFGAFAGASITLMAYQGTFLVISFNGVTFA